MIVINPLMIGYGPSETKVYMVGRKELVVMMSNDCPCSDELEVNIEENTTIASRTFHRQVATTPGHTKIKPHYLSEP